MRYAAFIACFSTLIVSLYMVRSDGATIAPAPPPAPNEIPALSSFFDRSTDYDFDLPTPGSYVLPAFRKAPNGTVLDHLAQPRQLHNILAGKISLVSFIYLACSDSYGCPKASALLFDIFHASENFADLSSDIQLISLSFNPERDTPQMMESFAYPVLADQQRQAKINWHFLTTENQAALAPLLTGFGQSLSRTGDPDVINHLLRLYLVDRTGTIRNVYGLGMIDPRLILLDVETLLWQEQTALQAQTVQ